MLFTSHICSCVFTESFFFVFVAMGNVINSLFKDGPEVMTLHDLLQGELPILEETRENFVFTLVGAEGVCEPTLNLRPLTAMDARCTSDPID